MTETKTGKDFPEVKYMHTHTNFPVYPQTFLMIFSIYGHIFIELGFWYICHSIDYRNESGGGVKTECIEVY